MDMSLLAHRTSAIINAEAHELRPALNGFLLFVCLFAGYFMLRPIRESMGITAGVENLQWLFTATFFIMLAAVPLFAWLSARVPRLHFVDWVYGFSAPTCWCSPPCSWARKARGWRECFMCGYRSTTCLSYRSPGA